MISRGQDTSAQSFEERLAISLEHALAGQNPEFLAIADGDPQLAERLRSALERALALMPVRTNVPLPPQLGPNLIESKLARGGMGEVLLARHKTLDRRVALKILPRPYAFVDERRNRFLREAQALAQVSHPGIVKIYDYGEQDGVPFLALEYIEGGSLAQRLRALRALDFTTARARGCEQLGGDGSYEDRVALAIAGVAAALEVIHGGEVVHRDLKPDNLLCATDGRLIIIDFGLALHETLDTITLPNVIVGTRHYFAPELTHEGRNATAASDIYALGVTLYEMLTLRSPFGGDSEEYLFRAIRERVPVRLRAINRFVSRDLESVCLKALEKDPRRRYATAAEFSQDLLDAAKHAPVKAGKPSVLRRATRTLWYRRRHVSTWVLLLALVTSSAAAGALAFRELQHNAEANRVQAERTWIRDFRQAEIAFANISRATPDDETYRLRQHALLLYEKCAQEKPERPESWLRLTTLRLQLAETEPARAAFGRAQALGSDGWYAQKLAARLEDRPMPTIASIPIGTARLSWEKWSPIDRLELARDLRSPRASEAFEIYMDPQLMKNEQFPVDALLGAALMKGRVFQDWSAQSRLALECFDRFLAENDDDLHVVAHNRAQLIRNAVAYSEQNLGASMPELTTWAEAVLRRRLSTFPSDAARAELADFLYGLSKYEEAREHFNAISPERLLELPTPTRVTALMVTVRERRYADAFALARSPGLETQGNVSTPLHRVVAYHQFLETNKRCPRDYEALRVFAIEMTDQVESQDLANALAMIDKELAKQQ